jgi:hypothetical protein
MILVAYDYVEICAFLGYYAAFSGSSVQTLRNNLFAPSSRVKKSLEDGADRLSRKVLEAVHMKDLPHKILMKFLSLLDMKVRVVHMATSVFITGVQIS